MSNIVKFFARNGLDNNGNIIANVSVPIQTTDAANKTYVDSQNLLKANVATSLSGYGILDAAPLSHTTDSSLHLTSSQNIWIDAITATSAEVNYLSGVSSAIQTQLNAKESSITIGTTAQYLRGDKTWQTLNSTSVGLSNVTNIAQLANTQTLILTGDITAASTALNTGTIATVLANSGITAGTYTKLTVDTKGRATSGALLSGSDVTTALTYTPVNKAGDTLTGFLTLNADPTSALHAATKQYVDNSITGLDMKASVKVNATSNITLSTVQTIDGVLLTVGDRVLVSGQTTGSQNGIYIVAAGAWTRAIDADTSLKVTPGLYVFIEQGTINSNTGWVLATNYPIALDTTVLSFTQFTGLGQITAGAGLTKTGTILDIVTASTSRIVVNADSIDLALVSQSTGSSFVKLTIDAYGRVSGSTSVAQADIVGLLAANSITETMIADGAILARIAANETIAGTWTFTNPITGSITGNAATSTKLTTARTIAITGDITYTTPAFDGSSNVTAAATLANSGITAGTYSSVTINAKGIATSGTTTVTLADGQIATANLTTTTTTANQIITSLSSSIYRSVKVIAQITSGSIYQVTELLIVHNGTTPTVTEYASVFTGTNLAVLDADVNAGNLRLLVTPTNAATTIKVIITAISI